MEISDGDPTEPIVIQEPPPDNEGEQSGEEEPEQPNETPDLEDLE